MLLAAGVLAACSYALYSTYDLLGPSHDRPCAAGGTVMGVTFISYAFNLNLGSLVGGVAFRYRLYSRLGLDNNTITRVLGFSMLTNWLGYLVVAGAAFCFWPMPLPPEWKIGERRAAHSRRASLLVGVAAYLAPLRDRARAHLADPRPRTRRRRRFAWRCCSSRCPASTGR